MWKKFITPFQQGLQRCEEIGRGDTYVELHFYVMIPLAIYYCMDNIVFAVELFCKKTNLPWYLCLTDHYLSFDIALFIIAICMLIWQFLTLRRFSQMFFIPLFGFAILDIIFYINIYQIDYDMETLTVIFEKLIFYACAVLYFIRRRQAFIDYE